VNANDKSMLEKVRAGWWVYTQGICIIENKWLLVAGLLEQYPSLVSVTDGRDIVSRCRSNILALHAPTDDPQMATAYKLGEPEEVTREEAEKMYGSGWTWGYVASVTKQHVIDCTGMLGNHATEICSPGGNVYRIKENAE